MTSLSSGHPSLSFTLIAGDSKAKLTRVNVEPPGGFGFVAHGSRHKLRITGVKLTGAKIKSLRLSHGQLVITLRRSAARVQVKITKALTESPTLMAKSRHRKLRSVRLTVLARTTQPRTYTLAGVIKRL